MMQKAQVAKQGAKQGSRTLGMLSANSFVLKLPLSAQNRQRFSYRHYADRQGWIRM